MAQAAQRNCQKGKWFGFDQPGGWLLFAVSNNGWWRGFDDDSPPEQQGIAWAINEYQEFAAELTGQPIEEEKHFQSDLLEFPDRWEFTDIDGSAVTLDSKLWFSIPEPPLEEPPEEETPPPPDPPPSPPVWFTQEPRSWHLAPLPGDFVFNLAWGYWYDLRSDDTVRARLIYPCDDVEPLPEGIEMAGDRVMVFSGEIAARLWAHIKEIIARQFD